MEVLLCYCVDLNEVHQNIPHTKIFAGQKLLTVSLLLHILDLAPSYICDPNGYDLNKSERRGVPYVSCKYYTIGILWNF